MRFFTENSMRTPRHLFMYMLGYLLLMEWLFPLPYISDTGFVPIFMLATGIFFLVMFFRMPWWASTLIMVGVILLGMHVIFYSSHPFLVKEWWLYLFADLRFNVEMMLGGRWYALSESFRSLLFFLLLAIMSYLIYFWVMHAKRVFFFIASTVIYVTVIDTFLPYNGAGSTIRIFLLGFLLMGVLQWDKISSMFSRKKRRSLSWKWSIIVIILIMAAAGAGFTAPKAEPQWPDPVPFIESAAGFDGFQHVRSSTNKQIGYGSDDRQLGGGFEMDTTPVFLAKTTEEVDYWRGESKDHYTGKGWEVTTPERYQSESRLYASTLNTDTVQANIEFLNEQSFDFAFYTGSLTDIEVRQRDVETQVNAFTTKAEAVRDQDSLVLDEYSFTYEKAEYPIDKMRNSSLGDPNEIANIYTRLPTELPNKVRELAEELTAGETNRYDKAKKVENFLRGPDFMYTTNDVPIPADDEDYVEQFLFESQQGYCDNFSTSMVVLLRAVDIPARWVKGFTSGNHIESTPEEQVYEVTNANAHSWVEVYFPEVGWVPFEPTKGFNTSFEYSTDTNSNDDPEEENDLGEEETEDVEEEAKEEEEDEKESSFVFSNSAWWMGVGCLVVIASVLYFFRYHLVRLCMLLRFKHAKEATAFMKAYRASLWFFDYIGLKREKSETLREYAKRVDEYYDTHQMSELTGYYEKLCYGKYDQKSEVSQKMNQWRELVQQIRP